MDSSELQFSLDFFPTYQVLEEDISVTVEQAPPTADIDVSIVGDVHVYMGQVGGALCTKQKAGRLVDSTYLSANRPVKTSPTEPPIPEKME